jgi:hypothetical protein
MRKSSGPKPKKDCENAVDDAYQRISQLRKQGVQVDTNLARALLVSYLKHHGHAGVLSLHLLSTEGIEDAKKFMATNRWLALCLKGRECLGAQLPAGSCTAVNTASCQRTWSHCVTQASYRIIIANYYYYYYCRIIHTV